MTRVKTFVTAMFSVLAAVIITPIIVLLGLAMMAFMVGLTFISTIAIALFSTRLRETKKAQVQTAEMA